MIITSITGIGDPQILLHDGRYYCYATTTEDNNKYFHVWQSEDLITWSDREVCFEPSKSFGKSEFWAPEVVYHGGKFIMHYTATDRTLNSLRIGAAVSDSPTGPFFDVHDSPIFDPGHEILDGSVLLTDEGNFLYYSRGCSENLIGDKKISQIYSVRLDDTLTNVISEPRLMTTPDREYEFKSLSLDLFDYPRLWNEGPTVIKHGDIYIMNYSTNYYETNNYAICLAVSDNPEGPWRKPINNPVTILDDTLFGAGHNAFFYGKDGELYTSFHVQTNPHAPGSDRRVVIGRVRFYEENGDIVQVIE